MKNATTGTLAFLLLVFLSSVVSGQSIDWRTDLDKAARESEIYDKPMLVYLSTDWCHYCRKMEDETFSNKAIKSRIADNFVPVSLNGEKYRKLSRRAGVRGFPASIVMNSKKEVLTRIDGYRTVVQLNGDLSRIDSNGERLSVFGKGCPVNPHTKGKFALGEKEWTTMHRGYRLYFASEENLNEFEADPGKYWPAMDGYCVVSALDDDEQRIGRLEYGTIYENESWFFASKAQKEKFKIAAAEYTKRLLERASQK